MTAQASPLTVTPEFAEGLSRLDGGDNMFLTGRAGTGKSTLIRQFLATTNRKVVVAAPTGIAALNVEGYTIHRLFSFGAGVTIEHVRSRQPRRRATQSRPRPAPIPPARCLGTAPRPVRFGHQTSTRPA
ncbi:AAA family ATPase [Nocardia fluminea]|uniref:AAA family ATPase n=1 Tax=Nocardia fluminea TaxID=134984 RepID=UPI0037123FF6